MDSSRTNERVFTVDPCSKNDLEKLAREALASFDPEMLHKEKPLNVRQFAEIFVENVSGWSLDVQENLPSAILGYCDPRSKTYVIPEKTYKQVDYDGRSRFTLIHECCHVLKHGPQMMERMVSMDETHDKLHRKSRVDVKAYMDPEWQANYLAGCLLMPRWHVINILRNSATEEEAILQIQKKFLVSHKAAEIRVGYVKK